MKTDFHLLAERLDDKSEKMPFHTGWYLKNIRTGEIAVRNGDVIVPSASTRKIAILMAALKSVNENTLTLNQEVLIEKRYQANDSGCFQHLKPGFRITFEDALTMMIIVSDNTCTGAVSDIVGLDTVNSFSRSIGMKGTNHLIGLPPLGLGRSHSLAQVNTTTPEDVGLLLNLILEGASNDSSAKKLGATPTLCNLALDILSWQKLKTKLPAKLPLGTKIAHKTGTGYESRNVNDAGIIFKDGSPLFILSVFTENVPINMPDGQPGYSAATDLIADMSAECYKSLSI